jgi:rhamnosyltransferase
LSSSSRTYPASEASLLEAKAVVAVVVTYQPETALLADVLQALAPQVRTIIIVDNGSSNAPAIGALANACGATWMPLKYNEGLASAQNIGLEAALDANASAVLLMDQDTILHPEVVASLVNAYNQLEATGMPVGSVGNAFRDTHDGKIASVLRARGWRIARMDVNRDDRNPIEVDFVIASGSLLPAKVLREIGLMDEPLFIDLVDLEWGFRASAHGYRHFQSAQVVMDHTIGAGRTNFAGRTISLHAPIRNYYWVRNALLLAKRSYIKPGWRLFFAYRAFVYLVVYSLKGRDRRKRFQLMLEGLWDGFLGRAGGHERI